ncbi:NADP-dependent oxidoreductase [Sphingomonas profundi]|uniref:NADP-dependent oxidoreductase n=1 Tax=Alterirhizorhabdus profundi TaxID=2681549 RepID=UPI0012E90D45|nr:NADP-dependent oxidoreductase [Sphingomonas profundi]
MQARANARTNRQWQVARLPDSGGLTGGGLKLSADVFGQGEVDVPEPGAGEVLIRACWFSPDPMNHAWVRGMPGKFDPIAIGQPMKGGVAGRVLASNHPDWNEGDGVTGFLEWQDYTVSDGTDRLGAPLQRVPSGVPLESGLATLGMTGLCAWLGLTDIGRPQPGDVVLVSGASGAIGSIAGQIARIAGARAIGIARGRAKCDLIASLGFDAVIDASEGDLAGQIAATAPDGVDVFFDNVGGPMLDAALLNLAHGARVVVCGATAHYDGPTPVTNHLMLAMRGATMAGFFYFDHVARWAEGRRRLGEWLAEGRIREALDIAEGFAAVPDAALAQFEGRAAGRKLVRIAEDPFA